jgi:hypothetical protein
MRLRSFITAGALALGSVSCGPGEEEIPPTFTNVQSQVFNLSCVFSACHTGAAPAAEMGLNMGAYEDIVNVASMQVPAKVRVKPGDPDGSYLMDKLLGKQTVGEPMPQGGMLEEQRLDLIRRWILAGAPND